VAARVAWSGTGVDLRTGTPSPEVVAAGVARVLAGDHFRLAAGRVAAEMAQLGDPLTTLTAELEALVAERTAAS
jgi:UDP:flavonoid glycosyltransferase YjiC (YdhE family)